MVEKQHLSPATILTGAVLILAAAAFPSDDARFTFAQGRVWLAILTLIAIMLLHLTRWQEVCQAVRVLFNRERPFNGALLVWWTCVLLSDLSAPNALLALKGSAWGQMGGGQLGLCVALFYLGQLARLEDRHWRVLGGGLGVMVVLALFEAVGLRPLFWLPTAEPYPATTIGQRGHLAGLFAAAAGFAAYRRAFSSLVLAGLGLCVTTPVRSLLI